MIELYEESGHLFTQWGDSVFILMPDGWYNVSNHGELSGKVTIH